MSSWHVLRLGQLRGSIDTAAPERSKHAGIFFDVKRSGEATRRPRLRIPPAAEGRRAERPSSAFPLTLGAATFAHGGGRARGWGSQDI